MTSYTVLSSLATVLLLAEPSSTSASLTWSRPAPGQAITIDAEPAGTDMVEAQRQVESSATLMDAIRTIRPHVVWRKIAWRAGHLKIDLVADSAIHANVATLALRRLFPGRSSAGTGIRQARRARLKGYGWDVLVVLAPLPATREP